MNSTTDQTSLPKGRLHSYDFLRGLAIIGVAAVHTSQSFPTNISRLDFLLGFGRFGVQLFFFVSSLTMCYMWGLRKNEKHPIRNFYIRRLFRIIPLFWIAIPIYLYLNQYNPSYWAPEGIGPKQIFLTTTFLHGFWPDSINSIVPGGWSIAAEVTFYFIFPFLILKIKDNSKTYLMLAMGIYFTYVLLLRKLITQFLAMHYVTSSSTIVKEFLYLNFLNQAPIFFLGCCLFYSLNSKINLKNSWLHFAWIGGAVLLNLTLKIEGVSFLLAYYAIAFFVILALKNSFRFLLFELLGKHSYAIYLGHFLVLNFLQKIIHFQIGLLNFIVGLTVTLFLSFILSLLVEVLIEKKIQNFAGVLISK